MYSRIFRLGIPGSISTGHDIPGAALQSGPVARLCFCRAGIQYNFRVEDFRGERSLGHGSLQ